MYGIAIKLDRKYEGGGSTTLPNSVQPKNAKSKLETIAKEAQVFEKELTTPGPVKVEDYQVGNGE